MAQDRLGRRVLDAAHHVVAPGVTTNEIDRVVHDETIEGGAYPSPLNYGYFPKSVCTSVNEVCSFESSFMGLLLCLPFGFLLACLVFLAGCAAYHWWACSASPLGSLHVKLLPTRINSHHSTHLLDKFVAAPAMWPYLLSYA